MAGLDELEKLFKNGRLVRPSSDTLNFVDLVRGLFSLAGLDGLPLESGAMEISRMIGEADHYLLILIDGLGMDQLRFLADSGFLKAHLVRELQPVFLSTTAAAMTTLATGQWPCSHGVPGWWMYLPGQDISVVTLPFIERMSNKPLDQFEVTASDLFPVPGVWPEIPRKVNPILPFHISDSVYTDYSYGLIKRLGYRDLDEALHIVGRVILNADKPSLTYLYLPMFDAAVHENGTGHAESRDWLLAIDNGIRELSERIAGKARLVISADHGMVDVPEEKRFVLSEDAPLFDHLRCVPSGEPRVPIFHVNPGYEEQFRREFSVKFKDYFILLTPDEVEQMHLMGPHGLSTTMRERLGTFVGAAIQPTALHVNLKDHPAHLHVGYHGGLSSQEMSIPLILV